MIFTALLATAAVAASPYYVPFIIATCTGIVSSITFAVSGYYLGKRQQDAEKKELALLKQELSNREREVRESTSTLAKKTSADVNILLKQSTLQQKHITSNIKDLHTQVKSTEIASNDITETATLLNQATTDAQHTIDSLTSELDQIKIQLKDLNAQLISTQALFHTNEQIVSETIQQLTKTQQSLDQSAQESTTIINGLTKQLDETQALLNTPNPVDSARDAEIQKLRADNMRLTSSIQTLELTIQRFTNNFQIVTQTNKGQLTEITALHDENKKLSQAIAKLSNALESKKIEHSQSVNNRGQRLFNPA